jgi:hypothetical protein
MSEPEGEIPLIENEEQLEALYAAAREKTAVRTACDDEEWDAAFPEHPLSRVRAYLRRVRETMAVDDAMRAAKSFGA